MSNEVIISTLFDEYGEDSRQQVQEMLNNFVQTWLPEKQKEINDAFQAESWESLREYLHAVKGTAGGYGYMLLTDISKSVEDKIKDSQYDNLSKLIGEFNSICARIYAGHSA